jgi:predicted nucleic acid-binding protein
MAGIAALFDTNMLIDYLSGVEAATLELKRYENRAINIITWMEVMVGVTEQDSDETRAFLATFVLHPILDQVAERAVALRRTLRLKLPDAILLATAELTNRRLITRNTRDFSNEDPRIHVP